MVSAAQDAYCCGRQNAGRPVCIPRKRSLSEVFLQEQGCAGPAAHSMLFPRLAPASGTGMNQGKWMLSATCGSGKSGLVPSSDAADKHCAMANTDEERPPLSGQGLNLASSPGTVGPALMGHLPQNGQCLLTGAKPKVFHPQTAG